MSGLVRSTRDAYLGPECPTAEEWEVWHRAMLEERAKVLAGARFDAAVYDDATTSWSDRSFRQYFLFMYDASFYDRAAKRYRTQELVDRWRTVFGRVDEVLLWHAYPRLGFDRRTQFDFYRDMPGGLAKLRAEVTDVLHAHGIRVLVDYNPWDAGTYDELGEIVAALDADGVMLDTMTDLPEDLARAVTKQRRGVIFAPELRAKDDDLRHVRQSWAQWFEVGDASTPSIYRQRWLVPRHRQHAIARWDTSRRKDIAYSFFNGSGLLLWENVFGTWNPYSRADRRLIAETAAVLDRYEDLFVEGEWLPLVPTGMRGVDANRWNLSDRSIVTFRNRTSAHVEVAVPRDGTAWLAFWGDVRELAPGERVGIEPEGVQAIVADDPARAREALGHFDRLSQRASIDLPSDDERCPRPRALETSPPRSTGEAGAVRDDMIALAGGTFTMRVRHERRECGCLPVGASDDVMWGWFYKDVVAHDLDVTITPFAMKRTAVTNAEYVSFVHATSYRPADDARFLAHLPRTDDGALLAAGDLAPDLASLPVTFVSLDDARAFASWRGERLPTEAEWQWAAEGVGRGRRFPWGDDERTFPEVLRPACDDATATPEGVLGLSGNTWELTESEHSDDHTRFVMLRGGVFLPPGTSEWLVARGTRPNDSHAKLILLADGLDRGETISFRTVCDIARDASR